MDDHWDCVRKALVEFHEVPESHADALIALTQPNERRRPEQCRGAADECFCASTWLSNNYWQWKAGGAYVPFSFREALFKAEKFSKDLQARPKIFIDKTGVYSGHAFTLDELVEK